MHYYMITYGRVQVEEIFFGETKMCVIKKARTMIDSWPEYAGVENEEILELAEEDELEFDLVKIKGNLPLETVSKEELIDIYQSQWGG